MAQLLPLPAVEGHPGRVAAVRADGDLEVDAGRHHDGPAQLRQHYAPRQASYTRKRFLRFFAMYATLLNMSSNYKNCVQQQIGISDHSGL